MRKTVLKTLFILGVVFVLVGASFFTGAARAEDLTKMIVIFPRSLEVLDDYYINVAWAMKYFEQEGLDVHAEGALGTTDASKLIFQEQGTVALPAPPVLFTAIANGLPITDVFQQDQNYIFGFGVRKDSGIESIADLKGKTISVGDVGWSVVIDPLLEKTEGFTTKDCQVVAAGPGRAQLVAAGKADAVFTWEKEYQLWDAQGIHLKIIRGYDDGVRFPGNGLTFTRKYIKAHPDRVVKFAKAWAKGIYFGAVNPAAATEITLEKYPMLGVAYADSLKAIKAGVWVMNSEVTEKEGLGYHDFAAWKELEEILFNQGTIPKMVALEDCITNEFIKDINDFDHDAVKKDAESYKLKAENVKTLEELGLDQYGW
jgi:NitT/TauT family transport system substrate-binding protein